jgi:transcriptional regulator with XRE-family HTH domain
MNIKKVIKQRGWTIERLSQNMRNRNGGLGVSHASVSSIVNGNPTLDKLVEISGIMGISVSELLADEPENMSTEVCCPHCGNRICINVSVEAK